MRSIRVMVHLAVLSLVMAVSACRTSGASRPERPLPTGDRYLIQGEELNVEHAVNLYDVVRIRRPAWLNRQVRNRSGNEAIAIYFDERQIGSLNILREMPIHVARSLRYLSPTEAQLRFGPQHGDRAAILVESKP